MLHLGLIEKEDVLKRIDFLKNKVFFIYNLNPEKNKQACIEFERLLSNMDELSNEFIQHESNETALNYHSKVFDVLIDFYDILNGLEKNTGHAYCVAASRGLYQVKSFNLLNQSELLENLRLFLLNMDEIVINSRERKDFYELPNLAEKLKNLLKNPERAMFDSNQIRDVNFEDQNLALSEEGLTLREGLDGKRVDDSTSTRVLQQHVFQDVKDDDLKPKTARVLNANFVELSDEGVVVRLKEVMDEELNENAFRKRDEPLWHLPKQDNLPRTSSEVSLEVMTLDGEQENRLKLNKLKLQSNPTKAQTFQDVGQEVGDISASKL